MLKGLCGLFLSTSILFAQSTIQATVVGAGYKIPAPLTVAPGQLVTLYLQGLDTSFPEPIVAVPTGNKLPTSLGGIAVTWAVPDGTTPLPIIEIRDVATCSGAPSFLIATCGSVTTVTAQIPFNPYGYRPSCSQPGPEYPPCGPTWLFVTVNNQIGKATQLNELSDRVHVLTACDSVFDAVPEEFPANTSGLPCAPMVTHGDGSLVSASNPAKAGEALTAWATGLGITPPFAGDIPSAAMPTAYTFHVAYNYTPNALANKPGANAPAVLYSGLVAGYLGLYQMNFVVPAVPQGTQPCAQPGTYAIGANVVQSNLTVSFGGNFSFDGAGICVAPVD